MEHGVLSNIHAQVHTVYVEVIVTMMQCIIKI